MCCDKCGKEHAENYKFYQFKLKSTTYNEITPYTKEITEKYEFTGNIISHSICKDCIAKGIFFRSLLLLPLIYLSFILTKDFLIHPNVNNLQSKFHTLGSIFANNLPLLIALFIYFNIATHWNRALSISKKIDNTMISPISKKYYKYIDETNFIKLKHTGGSK